MMRPAACLRLLISGLACLTAASAAAQQPPPGLTNARVGEDYGYLRDPANRTGAWWEPSKFVPLDPSGTAYLTLGADLRLRYERYRENLWGGPTNRTTPTAGCA
jgi:hypothetical protein